MQGKTIINTELSEHFRFTNEHPHDKYRSSKRSVLAQPTMEHEQSACCKCTEIPLSTIIVYHAYSEDNIRTLKSLLQRILACIMMVSFSQYKCVIVFF